MTRYQQQDRPCLNVCQCAKCKHQKFILSVCYCPKLSLNGTQIEICQNNIRRGWKGFHNCGNFRKKE